MPTTLTNGIQLPDKGSVDWYGSMQSNYNLIDTHLGNTDTHVTAEDKANWNSKQGSLSQAQLDAIAQVSTNTSDIATLQSGKAPLSHTHTKSDVTDLLNSNFIPSANNSYDLGSSSYQWNNLYAKNYYYNGVAWGLDKANEWTGNNTFSAPCKTLGKKLLTDITDLDDAYYNGEVCEFNPNTLHNPTGGYGDVLTINNAVNIPDDVYSSWITQIATNAGGGYLGIRNRSNGGAWTSWTRILTEDHAVPTVTNTYDLGTSTHKWKTFNGLTPSSLSLPNVNASSFVDISGYFTNTGNGDINTYSVTANGWIYLRLTDIDGCQLSVLDSSNNRLYGSTSSGNLEQLCLPVTAGTVVETQWTTSTSVTVAIARFIPCQGNI